MVVVKQKVLKQMVEIGVLRDVTNCTDEQWALIKSRCNVVAVSGTEHDVNGCILASGVAYFTIIGRTSRLFEVLAKK